MHVDYVTYDVYMKRTTVFLTDDLERLLQDTAARMHRPQAEIVRDALSQYFRAQPRPWPRSIGLGKDAEPSVTSENVKDWVRERWLQEPDEVNGRETSPPSWLCRRGGYRLCGAQRRPCPHLRSQALHGCGRGGYDTSGDD